MSVWTLWCGGSSTFFCKVEASSRAEAVAKCEKGELLTDWSLSDDPEADGEIIDVEEDT